MKKEMFILYFIIFPIVLSSDVDSAVVINEILANGVTDPESEWIELYNNESFEVNLANWNISETSSSKFTLNGFIPANGFVVLAADFATFNSTYPNVNQSGIRIINITISNFNLADTNGTVMLYNSSGALVDAISYVQASGKTFENISIGRYPDGSTSIFNLSTLTPGAKNDNQAPKLKWVNPARNNTKISGIANITANITDDTTNISIALINFNNTNYSMPENNGVFYFLWNTSLNLQKPYNITIFSNDSYGKASFDTLLNITVNRAPVLDTIRVNSEIADNITINETQKVNISINASDSDEEELNFHANSSKLLLEGNNFIWNTNLSDSGAYAINVSVNDTLLADSKIITINVLDAKDTDNDGNPDFNETDDDNDGILDENDFLIGNTSSINTTLSVNITINASYNLSKIFNGTYFINITHNASPLIEFNWTFNATNTLDFTNVKINKTTQGSSAVSIKGINMTKTNFTKSIIMEKINANVKSVCVKDDETSYEEISNNCNSNNEILLICNNVTVNGYTCFDTGFAYKITGLRYSAVKEECSDIDNDGYGTGCSVGTDCDDNDASKTTDCSSESSTSSGAASSGGGSGLNGYICDSEWRCEEWSDCINGKQTRKCSIVNVPNFISLDKCPQYILPEESKGCEVTKTETCSDKIKNQNEGGIDCGGICKPCFNIVLEGKKEENKTKAIFGPAVVALPTEVLVKDMVENAFTAISIIIVLLIASTLISFVRTKSK